MVKKTDCVVSLQLSIFTQLVQKKCCQYNNNLFLITKTRVDIKNTYLHSFKCNLKWYIFVTDVFQTSGFYHRN